MEKKPQFDLDNLQSYKQVDPDDMLSHIRRFPDLCEQAWQLAQGSRLPEDYHKINKIIVLGMGGSAIGGDLIAGLGLSEIAVPISVCREYSLPKWVDADTLVVASSYSGMTEETLSAFAQACQLPAKKLAITTGGKLKSICEAMRIPIFTFDYKSSPRAALPFSFFLLLGILQKLKVFKKIDNYVISTVKELNDMASTINENIPSESNPAKLLAHKLKGRLPVIYGGGITGPVAQRWKTQLNENSKTMAYFEIFSELNHNAIVGYQFPDFIKKCVIVMLDSPLLNERIRLRYDITRILLQQAGIPFHVLKAKGSNKLSQMMELIFTGDYLSYYLAVLNGIDPTEIKPINFLKDSLAAK